MTKPMTPKEFAERMREAFSSGDTEYDHVRADKLMGQLLTSLGYQEGVVIFAEHDKWYA